jgi:hypothetical protein
MVVFQPSQFLIIVSAGKTIDPAPLAVFEFTPVLGGSESLLAK